MHSESNARFRGLDLHLIEANDVPGFISKELTSLRKWTIAQIEEVAMYNLSWNFFCGFTEFLNMLNSARSSSATQSYKNAHKYL